MIVMSDGHSLLMSTRLGNYVVVVSVAHFVVELFAFNLHAFNLPHLVKAIHN